jgi:hypothetical protein
VLGSIQNAFTARYFLERQQVSLREVLARLSPQSDPVGAARSVLREAQLVQRQRQEELEAAVSATERTHALANSVNAAESEVREAEAAARAATRSWAAAGAAIDVLACDPQLLARVGSAHRRLADAKRIAPGASDALPQLKRAELEARAEVSAATENIRSAVTAVLVAMVQPNFEKLEHARAAYLEALAPLQAISQLFDPRWGRAHRWAGFRHPPDFPRQLAELTIHELSPAELDSRTDEWAAFGRRLATDSDADV